VTTVLLVGAGAVGGRAGRQLVETPGIERLLVADRSHARAAEVADVLGAAAEPIELPSRLPDGVAAVAVAADGGTTVHTARVAVAAGVPIATAADADDTVTALLGLGDAATRAGSTIAVGCALAPGLVEVLARHAAAALEHADEVHVARVGAAGPACVESLRRARRERALEWHDGAWRSERRLGTQLVWFPEPVGPRECEAVATGVGLLRAAVPGVVHATVRAGEPPQRSPVSALLRRRPLDDGWAGVRVEVWGWRGRARESIVYGLVERPAIAAGTVLAVTVARLAGLLPDVALLGHPKGAAGIGTMFEPAPFLAELARRGVKAAAFEGMTVG
jgi:hypothetical protein